MTRTTTVDDYRRCGGGFMKNFYCWYDNGSGWFEAMAGFYPVVAMSAEDALTQAYPHRSVGYATVVTNGDDPNSSATSILARRDD